MTESLLMQSVNITLIGMGIVLLFLLLLVAIMYVMSALVKVLEKYFPQAVPQAAAAGVNNALIAVAIAAAKRFQSK